MTPTPVQERANFSVTTQPLKSPTAVRQRLERLMGWRQEREHQAAEVRGRLEELSGYLATADKVTDALELLSQRLFKELLGIVEEKITIALQ